MNLATAAVPNRFRRSAIMRGFAAPMPLKHLCMEGEPGGGGGGGGGGGAGGGGGGGGGTPPADPLATLPAEQRGAIQQYLQTQIDTAVQGLKAKNGELIGAQKTLKQQLEAFDGIDPEAMRNLLKRFDDDEERGLLKEGKFEDVVKRRTERMQQAHQRELAQRDEAIKKSEAKAAKLAERATNEAVLKAATKAGSLPEATEDIVLRAKGAGWTISEDGDVVCLDKDGQPIFGKDGKTPMTPDEWMAGLREAAPHLWPRAQGSGANGSNGHAKGIQVDMTQRPEARMTAARMAGAR